MSGPAAEAGRWDHSKRHFLIPFSAPQPLTYLKNQPTKRDALPFDQQSSMLFLLIKRWLKFLPHSRKSSDFANLRNQKADQNSPIDELFCIRLKLFGNSTLSKIYVFLRKNLLLLSFRQLFTVCRDRKVFLLGKNHSSIHMLVIINRLKRLHRNLLLGLE